MSQNSARLYGLDLIRSVFILAVVRFHTHEAWVNTHDVPYSLDHPLNLFFEQYARVFAFGGQVLLLIFAFLLGGISRQKSLKLTLLLSIGVLVLAGSQGDPPFIDYYFEWDIYLFLLASFLLTTFMTKPSFRKSLWIIFVSLIVLLIPWWEFSPHWLSGFWKDALIGSCSNGGIGAWPLLPWVGLFFYGFGFGGLYRTTKGAQYLKDWQRRENFLWVPLLLVSLFSLGSYYSTPIDESFYCYVLRQNPLIFLGHLIFLSFLIRLSLITEVNQYLSQFSFLRWLSQRAWNRAFGIAYLSQFLILGLGSLLLSPWISNTYMGAGAFFAVLIGSEFIAQYFIQVRTNLGRIK